MVARFVKDIKRFDRIFNERDDSIWRKSLAENGTTPEIYYNDIIKKLAKDFVEAIQEEEKI